jgi:hypothetical protein
MEGLMIADTLAAISGFWFLTQAGYYLSLYRSLYAHPTQGLSTDTPPLSVIIVAKDQTEALQAHLPAILTQDYPEFEVIVVHDDAATECDDLLKRLEAEHKHLYHTFIPQSARYISHKKLGIAMGIKAAHHNLFVFTEPDSAPVSDQWLRRIAAHFTPSTDIVLGYSNYTPAARHSSLLLYDRALQQMRSLGMANEGHPYTASGRNMAYRRSLYQSQRGFLAHLDLQRGESEHPRDDRPGKHRAHPGPHLPSVERGEDQLYGHGKVVQGPAPPDSQCRDGHPPALPADQYRIAHQWPDHPESLVDRAVRHSLVTPLDATGLHHAPHEPCLLRAPLSLPPARARLDTSPLERLFQTVPGLPSQRRFHEKIIHSKELHINKLPPNIKKVLIFFGIIEIIRKFRAEKG